MAKRALLLLNRKSRQGADSAEQIVTKLEALGLEIVWDTPKKPSQIAEVIRRHQDTVELVIVGGGDGTINAAVDALVNAKLPVGILPLGTANDLARTLNLPTDPLEACQVIAEGVTKPIDVGCVNGKHFLNVASIGLSVDITKQLTAEVKRTWGIFAYLKTALAVVTRARPFHVEIRTPSETLHTWTVQIAVGNGRHYGGGMTVADDAAIDDQTLNLYSLEIQHWWQIIFLMPRLKTGSLRYSKFARTLRGKTFEIITRRPRSINTDGEITSKTPALFRVVPEALTVFVPAETAVEVAGEVAASLTLP